MLGDNSSSCLWFMGECDVKKLLLILLLSLGFSVIANANSKVYSCKSIDNSIYYDPSKQQYMPLHNFELVFEISNELIIFSESSTAGYSGAIFVVNDFIHDNNFNATALDETYSFSNLSYENGYLLLSWMNRGSASLGLIVAQCQAFD